MDESRFFVNDLADYRGEVLIADNGVEVEPSFKNHLLQNVADFTKAIVRAHEAEHVDLTDGSVYTGVTGVALLYLLQFKRSGDATLLQRALDLILPHLKSLKGRERDCTFLCGDCGPLAVAAAIYHELGPDYSSHKSECINRVVNLHQKVCLSQSLPEEMLYGRAGYLYALLFLQTHIGEDVVPKSVIIKVCEAIVKKGKTSQGDSPLSYTWHEKHYLGAAHGYAGIFYMLCKVSQKYPQFNVDFALQPSIDYLLSLRFPSGNFPSSLESGESDRLVHWCHGAPGFIYMFAAAYERYNDARYKAAALDCAEVIWKRGLLRKGYGICHGVSGNAYAFLLMYRLTGDEKYLYRACKFANWCFEYGQRGCRTPDRPYSLFEGLAGTCYFLLDLIHPKEARFPAFEI